MVFTSRRKIKKSDTNPLVNVAVGTASPVGFPSLLRDEAISSVAFASILNTGGTLGSMSRRDFLI